jgi:hypothetical protein
MEGTSAMGGAEAMCKGGAADPKKRKVDKQFYQIDVALEKHGLAGDVEKMRKIYGMGSVRAFPYILNESMLKKFEMAGTLQQYNEMYREARKSAQTIGDESMLAWELFSEADLLQQDAIRLEREGSSKAFCAICNCVKARCVEKESHFGIFDSSPPRMNCFYCGVTFSGLTRFADKERHQMLKHFAWYAPEHILNRHKCLICWSFTDVFYLKRQAPERGNAA